MRQHVPDAHCYCACSSIFGNCLQNVLIITVDYRENHLNKYIYVKISVMMLFVFICILVEEICFNLIIVAYYIMLQNKMVMSLDKSVLGKCLPLI